ncbi:wax ester/triacylglycerol synthase domain-containing protein [Streptomyces sp. NPDC053048]|uniref:wax ester/triacylglycerol synthase domain-containing protein n=1 Tax=Streptomyces sp. NPDC053048 TaxID=3365694 RepID=UPI0037CF7CC7
MTPHTSAPGLAPHALPGPAGTAAGQAMPPLDAWLFRHQSSGAMCMTDGVMAWFEGSPPTPAGLRERVRERWGAYERLRLTPDVAASGPRAWPRWTTGPGFAVEHHVVEGSGSTNASAEAVVGQLLAQPLGPARPPWQLRLLPADDGFALLLRAHHALLDGGSLIALLRALLDAPAALPGPRARRSPAPPPAGPARPPRLAGMLADLVPRARPLPFHGAVDARRVVSFRRLTVAEVNGARDALPSGRASANAVFLAAAAGALRATGAVGRMLLPGGVCAMVPVDVRGEDEAAVLGNRYATVRVPLPLGGGPLRRLAAVDAFTRRAALKERARAQARLVASRPRRHGLLGDMLGRYADSPFYSSLLCSSGATHAGRLMLGSASLTGLAGLPPLSPGHPLAVTMFTHDANAVVTVVTDHGHRDLAEEMSSAIRAEILAMRL